MARGSRGIAGPTLVGVAVLLNLILTVLLVGQVIDVRSEVDDLTNKLATKQDVAMLRPIRVHEILSENCTTCHADRRFAKALGMGMRQINDNALCP